MGNLSFGYKDSRVIAVSYHSTKTSQNTCFCCDKKVIDSGAVLLVNNYKYIPNVYMHSDCFEKWKDKTDELCSNIESSYQQFKRLNDVFGSYIETKETKQEMEAEESGTKASEAEEDGIGLD